MFWSCLHHSSLSFPFEWGKIFITFSFCPDLHILQVEAILCSRSQNDVRFWCGWWCREKMCLKLSTKRIWLSGCFLERVPLLTQRSLWYPRFFSLCNCYVFMDTMSTKIWIEYGAKEWQALFFSWSGTVTKVTLLNTHLLSTHVFLLWYCAYGSSKQSVAASLQISWRECLRCVTSFGYMKVHCF